MGVLNIGMGLAGMGLTAWDLKRGHTRLFQMYPVAFPTMLLCSLALLGSLLVSGILLLGSSKRTSRWVMCLYALEIVYFIAAALTRTGGAFAVGNVGLFPQLVTAFPIWGIAVIWWASRQSRSQKSLQEG